MAPTYIPEGDAFIPGRGHDEAVAALAAAEKAGLEPGVVRTVQGGYLVPEAVVEYYDGPASAESIQSNTVEPEPDEGLEAPSPTDEADGAAVGHGELDHSAQPGGAEGETLAQSAVASREAEAQTAEAEEPARSANKPEWVKFAVAQGASEEEALAQTKDQLIEQYGSSE